MNIIELVNEQKKTEIKLLEFIDTILGHLSNSAEKSKLDTLYLLMNMQKENKEKQKLCNNFLKQQPKNSDKHLTTEISKQIDQHLTAKKNNSVLEHDQQFYESLYSKDVYTLVQHFNNHFIKNDETLHKFSQTISTIDEIWQQIIHLKAMIKEVISEINLFEPEKLSLDDIANKRNKIYEDFFDIISLKEEKDLYIEFFNSNLNQEGM